MIVGAGYAGCVLAERIATQLDKRVLIVEKRSHIAGNAYDYFDEHGNLVHKYGPHIFHTKNKNAWDYLSQFTRWLPYYHHVLAVIDGKKVPVPFNLNSIYQLFSPSFAGKMENALLEKFGWGKKIPILKLRETKDETLKFLANFIYENVFYGYTLKQWGMKPEELDYSVTSRIPVFISRDNRYFQDSFQGIPTRGYTQMFKEMIAHPNIHLLLNSDFKLVRDMISFDKMIYTGTIDYFFDYMHGRLPYRSLKFDFANYDIERFQEVAQVNYPNNHNYTRITEFNHFNGRRDSNTTVAYEYPESYDEAVNEPYYPIPEDSNHELYKKYATEAKKLDGKVFFVGRLAEYKYYNMDEIVSAALMLFRKKIAPER